MSENNKKPIIKIPAAFQNMVLYMHHKCASRLEWSGPLLYRVVEGTIAEPSGLVISVEGFYPMNVGSSSFTEFESSSEMMEMLELWPAIDPLTRDEAWQTGLIHTHHGMTAYFSDVDNTELQKNSHHFPYYLSLIVNYEGKYTAKIGIPGTETTTTKKKVYIKSLDKSLDTEETRVLDVVYQVECDVEIEAPEWLQTKVAELTKPKTTYHTPYNSSYVSPHGKWDYKTQTYIKEGKEETEEIIKPKINFSPEYLKVLPHIGDLVSLGIQSTNTAPSWTFEKVGTLISDTQIYDYIKALVIYFNEEWSQGDVQSKIDDAAILVAIDQFVSCQPETWFKSRWKTRILPELYGACVKDFTI